jgi:para-aminobenzoate synthetase/4-amino-4-deoxychorismate lyase
VLLAREVIEESAADLGGEHSLQIYRAAPALAVAALARAARHCGVLVIRCIAATVDFADDPGSAPVRRRFESPLHVVRADTLDAVIPALDEADRLARSGLWVVGFVSYDASPAFDAAAAALRDQRVPLAWFAAFAQPASVSPTHTDLATSAVDGSDASPSISHRTRVSSREYDAAVEHIRQCIAEGSVYQVNFTVPFTATSAVPPAVLYERLLDAQRGRYAAHLDLGDMQIMSASPELFFERRGDLLRSRPMKGTAPRALFPAADEAVRRALLHSEKDRAENMMIVDVVRNDIGRIARTGSVRVANLCEAERYPRVWQLTSTVEGDVDGEVPLSRVFAALFPPASISGAPKLRASKIIAELEREPRAIYCGAIGMIRPGGDATFNVAIRTAWSIDAGRTIHLNAGGGVTIDSTPAGELAELRAKLAAFTVPVRTPSLFETIRVEHGRPIRLERHLARMSASADYFGLHFDGGAAEACVARAADAVKQIPVARCRLSLSNDATLDASAEPFTDVVALGTPRHVALARDPVRRDDVRLYHKTTDRTPYQHALRAAGDVFDVLLWNERGEATELSRGNLVAQIAGERVTPPVACGLLEGTLRAELLAQGTIRERLLTIPELAAAEQLWFINSLRGWVPIRLGD